MTIPRLYQLNDTYAYLVELDLYTRAAAASIAFNSPKDVAKLEPGYNVPIDLEDLHPMLRPQTRPTTREEVM